MLALIYGPVAGAIMGLMVGAMFFPGFAVTLPVLGLLTVAPEFGMIAGAVIGAIIGFVVAWKLR